MKPFSLIKRLGFLVVLSWYHTGYAQSDTLSLFTGLNEYKAPYYEMTKPNIIRISLAEMSFGFSGTMKSGTYSVNSQGELQENVYSANLYSGSFGIEYERGLDNLLGIGVNMKVLIYSMLVQSSESHVNSGAFGLGPKVGGFLTKYFELGRSKTKFFISPYSNVGFALFSMTDLISIRNSVVFYLDLGAVLGIDFVITQRGSIGLDIGYKFVEGFHFFSIGGVIRAFQNYF